MNELPWIFLDQLLGHMHSFILGIQMRMKLLVTSEHTSTSLETVKQFSKVVGHFISPLATHERLNYSLPLSTWFCPSLNNFSHSCVCVFNFQFSIDWWCWVSLHVLIGHLNIFFGKMLGVLPITLLEFVFFHSLDTYILQIFVRQTYCKHFLQSIGLPVLTFLNISLDEKWTIWTKPN